jgi:hypothetical protein
MAGYPQPDPAQSFFPKNAIFHRTACRANPPVLFECSRRQGMMEGYTGNYIQVTAPYREDRVNRIVDWRAVVNILQKPDNIS